MSINRLFRPHLRAVFIFTGVLFFIPVAGYMALFPSNLQEGPGLGDLFRGQFLKSLCNTLVLALGTACTAGLIGTLQAVFLQNSLQRCHQSVGVVLVEDDGRLHFEHIVIGTIGADENAVITHAIGDVSGVMGRGQARLRV